jgi:hypothetical protein
MVCSQGVGVCTSQDATRRANWAWVTVTTPHSFSWCRRSVTTHLSRCFLQAVAPLPPWQVREGENNVSSHRSAVFLSLCITVCHHWGCSRTYPGLSSSAPCHHWQRTVGCLCGGTTRWAKLVWGGSASPWSPVNSLWGHRWHGCPVVATTLP